MDYLLCGRNGSILSYDPTTSELTGPDGKSIFPNPNKVWRIFNGEPDNYKKGIRTLKILLGMQCNFSCRYCNQADKRSAVLPWADIPSFLDMIAAKDWNLTRIEFWGGEPFLHWPALVELVAGMWKLFPEAEMSVVTNGSLLDQKRIDFLRQYNVQLVISHDGPGQYLRTGDPLYNQELLTRVRELAQEPGYKDRSLFNAVLTPINYDPVKVIEHFSHRVHPDVIVSFEGAVSILDCTKDDKDLAFDENTGNTMAEAIAGGIITGKLQNTSFMSHLKWFMESLQNHQPAGAIKGKCGMNKADTVALDLAGNILLCQNTTEKIGHINNLSRIDVSKMTPWLQREGCAKCVVQQLCKGGCMTAENGPAWKQTCTNNFYYHLGIFSAAFYLITGDSLLSINEMNEEG